MGRCIFIFRTNKWRLDPSEGSKRNTFFLLKISNTVPSSGAFGKLISLHKFAKITHKNPPPVCYILAKICSEKLALLNSKMQQYLDSLDLITLGNGRSDGSCTRLTISRNHDVLKRMQLVPMWLTIQGLLCYNLFKKVPLKILYSLV